jgi:putative membrane protein
MSAVRFLVAAVVFVALLLLALSNTEPITLRFFHIASHQSPLAFVVFVAFAAGVATGLLAGAARRVRLKRQLMRMRRHGRASSRPPGPHGAAPRVHSAPLNPPQDAV